MSLDRTMSEWPALSYSAWSETCDTLHAHTQVLGKIAVALAPKEPELQHGALRLTVRGWETRLLPTPNGSGGIVVVLDLHRHVSRIEHSDGSSREVALTPHRSVGEVTGEVLAHARDLAGPLEFNPKPSEVPWTLPLDDDQEHTTYDVGQVVNYFAAATRAALVLGAFRAPYRGRSTQVNAWWGSFDLGVTLFSGQWADPPSDNFIMRNSMDMQEVSVGWWPGDLRHDQAAFYGYAHPAPDEFSKLELPLGEWSEDLGGEYILDWDAVRSTADPHSTGLDFARRVFRHACAVCGWDPTLAASSEGSPPPVR